MRTLGVTGPRKATFPFTITETGAVRSNWLGESRSVNARTPFVVAVTTPYVARVNADGTFQLKNVPAGTYRLRAWHERASEVVQMVTVPANGANGLSITLDARAYVPAPHPDKFGKPYASTRADRY